MSHESNRESQGSEDPIDKTPLAEEDHTIARRLKFSKFLQVGRVDMKTIQHYHIFGPAWFYRT